LRHFRSIFLFAIAGATAIVVACGGDDSATNDPVPQGDSGPPPIGLDAHPNDNDAESPMSTMRLAHLAPHLGPVDFCYQAARTGTFIGPVLNGTAAPKDDGGGDAEAGLPTGTLDASALLDANTPGVEAGALPSATYRTVTKYLNLEAAGPITLSIVEGGSRSCANAIATADVTLDPGKLSTVALFSKRGDGGVNSVEVVSFTDDRTTDGAKIRVRVIHAALGKTGTFAIAPAGPLAARVVSATKATVLTDRVEPRKVSTASQAIPVDALGYTTADPVSPPASIAIGPAATDGGADAGFETWQSKSKDLDLRGDSLHTAFILSGENLSSPNAGDDFEVLWCADTTTTGDQSACEVLK
jgi:hypothetical protein